MRRSLWTLVLVTMFALVTVTPATPARAATPVLDDVLFAATAHGGQVISGIAKLSAGPVAYSGVGCTKRVGVSHTNSVASASLPGVLQVGAVRSATSTSGNLLSRTARAENSTAGVNLLGGLVTATAVKTTSVTSVNTLGVATSSGSMTATGLKVGGVPIAVTPAPNTSLTLRAGSTVIGRVVLNETARATSSWSGSATTRAISIYITAANSWGLPVGARVIVGSSGTALKASPAGQLGGYGFSVRAKLADGTVRSGPYAYMSLACMGGTTSASTVTTSIPSVVQTGATQTTAVGVVGSPARSTVVNRISGTSLLGGLVTADTVTASTSTTRAAKGAPAVSTDSSTVANLRVAGLPLINGSVAPNTVVHLPGVATLTLHKVVKTSSGITVTMIEIRLEKLLGSLPTNSVIEIGVSATSVAP